MKILIPLFLYCLSAFASHPDMTIAKENINRLVKLNDYYDQEVYPLLKRFETDTLVVFNSDEKKLIKDFWTVFNDTKITLSTLAQTTEQNDPLLRYSINLHINYSAVLLSSSLWNNPKARKRLDDTNTEEIPRGSFVTLENELFKSIGFDGEELPSFFPTTLLSEDKKAVQLITDLDLQELNRKTEKLFSKHQGFLNNIENFKEVKKRFRIYKFKNIFYHFVRKIATWLGDTKTRNRNPDYYNGNTLIDIELAMQMEQKVTPGDIMLSRTDWFLSNMFLPGFWSHSFIYLGDETKLKNYFNSAEVNAHYLKKCQDYKLLCDNFVSYLKQKFPAYLDYQKKDKYGYPQTLIEATSKGVHFSTIRYTFLNDYLAALRPMISKLEKAKTIETAFEFYGADYDYDFDYSSDDKVVCSELVGKSISPYVQFNYDIDKKEYLEYIMGRVSMPVQNILKKFYDEDIKGVRKKELKFIAYLKGYPKLKKAKFVTKDTFFESLKNKKWKFMD